VVEVEEEEKQHLDEELRLKQEQKDIQKWHLDYIQLMEHIKNPKYISRRAHAEARQNYDITRNRRDISRTTILRQNIQL
jgi:hypothetical protein